MKFKHIIFFLLAFVCQIAFAQLEIELEQVASGLSSPVDMAHAGDDRLFIVERSGRIKILNQDGSSLGTFLDIDSKVAQTGGQNEQGLLGLAFHPNYADNGYFFVHYTDNGEDGVLARYSVDSSDPNKADVNSEKIIMEFAQPTWNHNGGCIKFGPDGYLYIGMGDGGFGGDPGNRSQNRQLWLGKMLRIDVDNGDPYSIPADNPFVNDDETLDEIWAIGVRNPWKFSFDKETGDMWIADVGQNAWEEIHFQAADSPGGENYGWRCYEGNNDFNTGGCGDISQYEMAIAEYNHQGFTHCSVTGGFVYRGSEFPSMVGHYVFADYCSGRFWSIVPDGSGGWDMEEVGSFPGNDVSSFGEDVNGELYSLRLGQGRIYRVKAVCPASTEINLLKTIDGALQVAETFTAYQWFLDGNPIDDATDMSFMPTTSGTYTVQVTDEAGCTFVSDEIPFIATNVANLLSINELEISPNPFNDFLQLQINVAEKTDLKVTLTDIRGKVFYNNDYTIQSDLNKEIELNDLPAGIYFINLSTSEGNVSRKLVKQ